MPRPSLPSRPLPLVRTLLSTSLVVLAALAVVAPSPGWAGPPAGGGSAADDAPPANHAPLRATPAPASPTADTSDGPWVNLRPYPLALWGPRVGFGGGAGLVVHDLGRPGSRILASGAVAQHASVVALSVTSTTERRAADRYVVVDARWADTDRQRFYGRGPAASSDARLNLDLRSWWARLRVGVRLLGGLRVQPRVSVVGGEVRPGSPADLPAGTASGAEARLLQPGVDVILDTRNRTAAATRGVRIQAGAFRAFGLDDSALRYDRLSLAAQGFLPLGGRHRLAGRLRVDATARRGDARVPFFLLPRLDGRTVPGFARGRFFGSERVVASALYRFPIARPWNLFHLDGHLGVHAASVYDDFGQFTPAVSFDERLDAGRTTYPLRPAVSAGLRLGPVFRDETYVGLAAGWSPDGLTLVHFRLGSPLDLIHPPHHAGPPSL